MDSGVKYGLLSPCRIACVHVSRADQLGLKNQWGSASLEETDFISLSSYWTTIVLHLGWDHVKFPCPRWWVNWWYHYASLVQTTHCWNFMDVLIYVIPKGLQNLSAPSSAISPSLRCRGFLPVISLELRTSKSLFLYFIVSFLSLSLCLFLFLFIYLLFVYLHIYLFIYLAVQEEFFCVTLAVLKPAL